jgi:hypothetical protein
MTNLPVIDHLLRLKPKYIFLHGLLLEKPDNVMWIESGYALILLLLKSDGRRKTFFALIPISNLKHMQIRNHCGNSKS